MIASLQGKLSGRIHGSIIIDVNQVGYLVAVSQKTLENLGSVGDDVRLSIITQVREDAITLIGFMTLEERDVFSMLTSVQGVGTKAGLSILSVLSPDECVAAILQGEVGQLTKADGVGPKLANRLIAELQTRARALGFSTPTTTSRGSSEGQNDAMQGLLKLGYGKLEAQQLLDGVMQANPRLTGAAAILSACLKAARQNTVI